MKRSTRKLIQKLLNECIKTQNMENRASFHYTPSNYALVVFDISHRDELYMYIDDREKYINHHIKSAIAQIKALNKPD